MHTSDDFRFPDGAWEGFYLMGTSPRRHWMDLWLAFKDGTMKGEGQDPVGKFLVRGNFESESGKCTWHKKYIAKHDVFYLGYNEGKGIWGKWEIPPESHGGFHIWPEGMPNPYEPRLHESLELPEEALSELVESVV